MTKTRHKLLKNRFWQAESRNPVLSVVITCNYSILMSENISGHRSKLKNPLR